MSNKNAIMQHIFTLLDLSGVLEYMGKTTKWLTKVSYLCSITLLKQPLQLPYGILM